MTDVSDKAGPVARGSVIAGLVLVFVAVLFLAFGGGDSRHHYTLLFENAGQLVDGNEVKIGGAPVGMIENLRLTDDGLAEVDVAIDQELHEGTKAVIRAVGLVGVANHYISIEPGLNTDPPLDDGATITEVDTTTSVDIDQVFNSLDKRAQRGLSEVIRGQGDIYAGKGKQANASYKYLEPALSQTNLVLDELNRDSRTFEQFLVGGSKLFTALADRNDDLSSSLTNARQAFDAINSQTEAFSEDLSLLAPVFRQSNTTFLNLRTALDDVDTLVDAAYPATKDLAPFLRDIRPVVHRARPFFGDLSTALVKKGPANDLGELTASLPTVDSKAGPGFRHAQRAIADFEPTLSFARPYGPEMLNALAKLGQVTSRYDGAGHYVTVRPSGNNLFDRNNVTGVLDSLSVNHQYDAFSPPSFPLRCPGAASQPAADGSSPFVAPNVPDSGLNGSDCDPGGVPPGP